LHSITEHAIYSISISYKLHANKQWKLRFLMLHFISRPIDYSATTQLSSHTQGDFSLETQLSHSNRCIQGWTAEKARKQEKAAHIAM